MQSQFRIVWQDNELVRRIDTETGFFKTKWKLSFQINLPILSIGAKKDPTNKKLPLEDGKNLQNELDKQVTTKKTPKIFNELITKLQLEGEDPKNLVVMVVGLLKPCYDGEKFWNIFSEVIKEFGEKGWWKNNIMKKECNQIIFPAIFKHKDEIIETINKKHPFLKSYLQDIFGIKEFTRTYLQSIDDESECIVYIPTDAIKIIPFNKICKICGIVCYDAIKEEDVIRTIVVSVKT